MLPQGSRCRCPGPRQLRPPEVEFLSLVALEYIAAMLCSNVLCVVFWVMAFVPRPCLRLVLAMHYT